MGCKNSPLSYWLAVPPYKTERNRSRGLEMRWIKSVIYTDNCAHSYSVDSKHSIQIHHTFISLVSYIFQEGISVKYSNSPVDTYYLQDGISEKQSNSPVVQVLCPCNGANNNWLLICCGCIVTTTLVTEAGGGCCCCTDIPICGCTPGWYAILIYLKDLYILTYEWILKWGGV